MLHPLTSGAGRSASLRSIPVIAISAGGKEAQDRVLALGADVYLRKPVKFTDVKETVKQILRIG